MQCSVKDVLLTCMCWKVTHGPTSFFNCYRSFKKVIITLEKRNQREAFMHLINFTLWPISLYFTKIKHENCQTLFCYFIDTLEMHLICACNSENLINIFGVHKKSVYYVLVYIFFVLIGYNEDISKLDK